MLFPAIAPCASWGRGVTLSDLISAIPEDSLPLKPTWERFAPVCILFGIHLPGAFVHRVSYGRLITVNFPI